MKLAYELPPEYTLLIDLKSRKVGCPILQACAGVDYQSLELDYRLLFPPETWFLTPTPDARLVSGTKEQWQHLSAVLQGESNA